MLHITLSHQAWAEAVASTQQNGLPAQGPQGIRYSGWPVIMFFAVVAAAPYIVLKMMTRLNSTIQETCKYDFVL